jgi:hypothetical protein
MLIYCVFVGLNSKLYIMHGANIKKGTIFFGKGKVFPYSHGVAQRVGRGIPLLFHDRGTRRG